MYHYDLNIKNGKTPKLILPIFSLTNPQAYNLIQIFLQFPKLNGFFLAFK